MTCVFVSIVIALPYDTAVRFIFSLYICDFPLSCNVRFNPIPSSPSSAVFTWTNLLVVVSELAGSEQEALDLVPLVTNVVLEEHHLIVGVVVIVDPGVIPINSRGEKQRIAPA